MGPAGATPAERCPRLPTLAPPARPPARARPPQALRPLGVKLMKAVVRRFGEVEDPLAEGSKLLELYQAQVVSAIRWAGGRAGGWAGGRRRPTRVWVCVWGINGYVASTTLDKA